MFRVGLALLLLWVSFCASAQVKPSTFRSKSFQVTGIATHQIDTLSIVPSLISVKDANGLAVDTNLYTINYSNATIYWKGLLSTTIIVSYKVYPILFAKSYFNKDVGQLDNLAIDNRSYYVYKPIASENTLFSLQGLNKSGSISRGVMFGNNQNMSVNANMVLQMSGKIANDIEILAAISDDNLPIQPQGNTQQLNDFDRVFIQVKKDSTKLIAGDYELNRPGGYFMNFYKRAQGASLNHSFSTNKGVQSSSTLALAVAKGRSTRNMFNGLEGNQGPYRLKGKNNENYIVVIAGTERVFIDGILLTRGQDNDYVIDYNTSEITFTPKQIITLNSRISVEFEYADKNFARTLTFFNQAVAYKNTAFRLNYYSEKDNRNHSFLQPLTDEQKQYLATIGKNVDQAFYPNVTEVPFSTEEVLYKKEMSLDGDSYYTYSTDPQLAKYRVGFSYVGAGNGNYKLDNQSAANGRVYTYVSPVGSTKQGDYEPISLLITPKQQQLITVGADVKPTKESFVTTELALSNYNANLFAEKQSTNVNGYGFNINGAYPFLLQNNGLVLRTKVNYELASAGFKPLERYRTVEFSRDFNLDLVGESLDEHLLALNTTLFKDNARQIGYSLNSFKRGQLYKGLMHKVNAAYKVGTFGVKYDGSFLKSDEKNLTDGLFDKHFVDINKEINSLVFGVSYDHQRNETIDLNSAKLTANSQAYAIYKVYMQSKAAQKNRFNVDYSFRADKLPLGDNLLSSASANTFNIGLSLAKNLNSVLNLTAGYRSTNYHNGFANTQHDENLVGKVDYSLNLLSGFINTNLYYEVGNGQEPRREVTYLEVMPGQGVYAWNDYNNNGIKELDEFEVSRFPDQAKFIRVFTSSTTYIRTNFTGFNQSLRITPSAVFKQKNFFSAFVNRFSDQMSYKVDRKILAGNGFEVYNPFNVSIDADNLIALTSFFKNTLYFNRNNAKIGFEFNYLADGGRSFLSNGFDSRDRKEYGLRLRTAPLRSVNINLTLNNGGKRYISDLFAQRNYRISYTDITPEVNYQYSSDLRMTFAGVFGMQQNAVQLGNEQNSNITFFGETRYNVLKRGVLTGKLSFINNKFSGNANSTIGYEMLAGLQTGNNYTCTLGLQRAIGSGVQLNLSYEGRKSEGINVVHTGNMQVRAFF